MNFWPNNWYERLMKLNRNFRDFLYSYKSLGSVLTVLLLSNYELVWCSFVSVLCSFVVRLTGAGRVWWTAKRHEDQGCVAFVHLVISLAVTKVTGAAWTTFARPEIKWKQSIYYILTYTSRPLIYPEFFKGRLIWLFI